MYTYMASPLQIGRYGARLAALPPDALLALALKGCEESAAVRTAADASLAQHAPLPQWARDEVLLSPDLMPQLSIKRPSC